MRVSKLRKREVIIFLLVHVVCKRNQTKSNEHTHDSHCIMRTFLAAVPFSFWPLALVRPTIRHGRISDISSSLRIALSSFIRLSV